MPIHLLERSNTSLIQSLHQVFLKAYAVEADLIGVARNEFYPLQQTVEVLKNSSDEIWYFADQGLLQGAIFLEQSVDSILISHLVVDPHFFRKGVGVALMEHALKLYPNDKFNVSTGSLNFPALQLYKKFVLKSWVRGPSLQILK